MQDSAPPLRRVFFAAPLDQATVRRLLAAAAALHDERLRWLPSAGWHLTLRFVGDVAMERVEELTALVPAVALGHAPFQLMMDRLCPFPDRRRPAVLAAVADAVPSGLALVEDLETASRAMGFTPQQRPWRPHVSLARVRRRGRDPLPSAALRLELPVTSMALMESLPGPEGRRYVALSGRHPLRGAASGP